MDLAKSAGKEDPVELNSKVYFYNYWSTYPLCVKWHT